MASADQEDEDGTDPDVFDRELALLNDTPIVDTDRELFNTTQSIQTDAAKCAIIVYTDRSSNNKQPHNNTTFFLYNQGNI